MIGFNERYRFVPTERARSSMANGMLHEDCGSNRLQSSLNTPVCAIRGRQTVDQNDEKLRRGERRSIDLCSLLRY